MASRTVSKVSWTDVIEELERRAILFWKKARSEKGNFNLDYLAYADMNRLLAEKIRKEIR